ncbi:RNA12 protein-domain-containing protein [Radiomyces spectabilis]|uniref:RNA12 protein-domain-containing protein n=1 Tax=Radiomyces spectabilis TaxID=64574 RepID=UPI00221F6CAD|nr:RNA12 protein-domain-containing protein [Radiomyces spectabilis]KAI8390823.1 RNA12 protein-domain-containing protein [Radiomyces spectabilis]
MLLGALTCSRAGPRAIATTFRPSTLHSISHTRAVTQSHVNRYFGTTSRRAAEELGERATSTSVKLTSVPKEQTAMLFLDNVFPLRMNVIDIRQFFFRDTRRFLETRTSKAVPSKDLPFDFAIKDIQARTKDGGAIVKFTFQSTDEEYKTAAKEIVSRISEHLSKQKIVAPFNLQPLRAFLVKGEPFLEDILSRYPTPRLRLEFQGEPCSVEKLYKHLRQYGRVYDISLYPNPHVAKDPARYAIVQFTRVRAATSAKNCLHGHIIHNTRLNILYERQLRTNVVKEWLVSHPRITIPVIAALIAGVTYAVFDPIRVFFITSKVTQRFNPEEYALYRWVRTETWARLLPTDRTTVNRHAVWADDKEHMEKVKTWLRETPESFIVVTGPKGSGKSALIKAAIDDRHNKLFIDCEQLVSTRNKSEMTKLLAKQVGYFPIFTWVASTSSLMETVVTAATGQKTGLSSSPDSQMKGILETVAIALRDIVPKEKASRHSDLKKQESVLTRLQHWVLEHVSKEHHEKKEENYDEDVDDVRDAIPIVVLENYMHRETGKNAQLWDELAEWASLLVENEIAHVVFVSSNVSISKVLTKALPNKTFSNIVLSDAPPEVAISFISKQLGLEKVDENLHDIVAALGGRLTELELLVQKMKMNMDAQSAFDDIVQRNVIEIRKYGFGESGVDDNRMEWSPIQFWDIVKRLTKAKSINYDELKWSALFNGSDKALKAMERAELITVMQTDGRPNSIRPGKPIFYTVFHRLVMDSVFAASMEIETNQQLKKTAEDSIAKFEDTIEHLSKIYNGRPPQEIDQRIKFLLQKVKTTQKQLEGYEKAIANGKEIISKAWQDE